MQSELVHALLPMLLHGFDADAECVADALVGLPFRYECKDFSFASSKSRRVRPRPVGGQFSMLLLAESIQYASAELFVASHYPSHCLKQIARTALLHKISCHACIDHLP